MADSGAERASDRRGPVALKPDADRSAAEEAKFAELRSLLVGPERREVVDLKAQLADRHARTLEISDVLPDAIAHSAKNPQLGRALSPAIEQAISASVREDPRPLAEALFPIIGRAVRKSMAQSLAPWVTLVGAVLLVGGVWLFQDFRVGQQWDAYLERLSAEPGIVVIQNGRRGGKFFVRGLRDDLAIDPASLLASAGLSPEAVESRWEPYLALHPTFVAARAGAVLRPPAGVTLTFNDGVLTASGTAPAEWIGESRRIAPTLAGVRQFESARLTPDAGARQAARIPSPAEPIDVARAKPDPAPGNPQNAASTLKPAPRPSRNSPEFSLIEQIEVSSLVFSQSQRDLAPGQEPTVRRLATLFRELNEIVHARGARAAIAIVGHTSDESNVANRRLAKTRADAAVALFRPYKFDALVLTADPEAVQDSNQADVERNRRVSFRVRLLARS